MHKWQKISPLRTDLDIEYFILKLGCLNSEKALKWEENSRLNTHVVKSTWTQALSRSRKQATEGKTYWYTRYDVTGSDLHSLPYYSLAVTYLKVPSVSVIVQNHLILE